MVKFTKNITGLVVFCIGGGSKLLQSQIDGSEEVLSIPAYPLKYFYPFWKNWKKKYRVIDLEKSLELVLKHHSSLIDTRNIPGNNGLFNLGRNKKKYIKISKKKFIENYRLFLKGKKINSKNVLLAIHYAYFKSKGKKLKKLKTILYHIHEIDYFNNYLIKDFPSCKLIACCRDPINYFWKKINLDHNIEIEKFNKSDQILLKQNDYINALDSIFCGFKNINKNFFNKYLFVKFEDLKTKNNLELKKVFKYLKIKFASINTKPTFEGLDWWSDKKYGKSHKKTFDGKIYNYNHMNQNFFSYEIFVLKYILNRFFIKLNYKDLLVNEKLFLDFYVLTAIFFPTKFGIKSFINYINPLNFCNFIANLFDETFLKNNLKNYYFHGMFDHKKQYKNRLFLRINLFRKNFFLQKNKHFNTKSLFYKFSHFLFMIFVYLISPINFIFLYFKKISMLIKNYFYLKSI